jgi:hypothetical protein
VSEELKACPNPWCASHRRPMLAVAYAPYAKVYTGGYYRVVCAVCPQVGPTGDDDDAAITAWNTRPEGPSPQAVAEMRRFIEATVQQAGIGLPKKCSPRSRWVTIPAALYRRAGNIGAWPLKAITMPADTGEKS